MRIVRAMAFLLAGFLAAGPVRAQEPRIQVRAEPQSLALGDSLELDVVVETRSLDQPDIQLPPLNDFNILSRSVSTPMQFSFSFGSGSQVSRTTQYQFVLSPRKSGDLAIGPVTVAYSGKRYQSRPLVIHVLAGAGRAPAGNAPAGQGGPAAEPQTPTAVAGSELKGVKVDDQLFVQTVVSKTRLYLGETATLSLYLYSAVQLSDVNVKREPGTDDFWSESLMPPKAKVSFEDVVVNNRLYQRALLRQSSLSALKPGKLTIAPAVVEGMVGTGMFFSRQKVITRVGQPVVVEVLPLPAEGKPAGFEPGNVGSFTMKAALSATRVKTGEPVTLRVDIEGEGNVRAVKLDVWKELEGFRVYEPQVTDSTAAQGSALLGRRTVEVLLIPEKPGTLRIPPIALNYFEPGSGTYKSLSTSEFSVDALPGAAVAATNPAAGAPVVSGPQAQDEDKESLSLRSIVEKTDLKPGRRMPLYRTWWYLLLLLAPPVSLVSIWTATRIRERRRAAGPQTRWRRAAALARRRIRESEHHRASSPERFFGDLSRALLGYLEDRTEVPFGGCTTNEIRRELESRGYAEGLVERVLRELEAMDFARFSSGGSSQGEMDACLGRVEELLKDLERVEPRRGGGEARA